MQVSSSSKENDKNDILSPCAAHYGVASCLILLRKDDYKQKAIDSLTIAHQMYLE